MSSILSKLKNCTISKHLLEVIQLFNLVTKENARTEAEIKDMNKKHILKINIALSSKSGELDEVPNDKDHTPR